MIRDIPDNMYIRDNSLTTSPCSRLNLQQPKAQSFKNSHNNQPINLENGKKVTKTMKHQNMAIFRHILAFFSSQWAYIASQVTFIAGSCHQSSLYCQYCHLCHQQSCLYFWQSSILLVFCPILPATKFLIAGRKYP